MAYAQVLAFVSGMCIMATEVSAARLLAPFFGTSTFVWTNVIGGVMVALSAGYLVGGRLADRRPDLRLLLRLLVAASLFLAAVPFLSSMLLRGLVVLLERFESSFTLIFAGSLVAIVVLFAPPIFVMGMTGPFLVRLTAAADQVGAAAASVFGLSTLGSIAGTFLPILVFIPRIGTARTILFFALVLLLSTASGLGRARLAGAACLAVVALALPGPRGRGPGPALYRGESAYQYLEVLDDETSRYLAIDDAQGFQTVGRKDGGLTGFYFDYYSLVPFLVEAPGGRVLLVGLGGGTIANQIHRYHPSSPIDAVEIDPEVIAIARRFFGLTGAARVYNEDGRVFVASSRSRYDVVIVDAYARQIYIPFHLATAEFFAGVKRILAEGGILAMNVASSGDDSILLRSLLNTLASRFRHVSRLALARTPSTVVLASETPLATARLARAAGTELGALAQAAAAGLRPVAFDPELPRLTDDRAPIEQMVDWDLLGRGPGR